MESNLLIHPDRLHETATVFEGRIDLEDFPRLAESIAEPAPGLHYRVEARLDAQRRKVVSCIIEGFVFLTCQTTLESFRHAISIDERIVLVDRESMLPPIEEESDAEDYLVADDAVDVRSLIEDAILLALPMVPRKPGLDEAAGKTRDEAARESPFAALASLKKPD